MSDHVLKANERGHSAEDVEKASELIREYGFELGLQMMMGLYGSTLDDDIETALRIIDIHPDTVRIYPVVILKGTKLADLYESGVYKPCSFNDLVEAVSVMLIWFKNSNIRVIKCGLHASEFVEKDMIGGFYHPAFRDVCESEIYKFEMKKTIGTIEGILCSVSHDPKKHFEFAVAKNCISKALGHKKSNVEYFRQGGIEISIIGDDEIPEYEVQLRR